MNAEFVAHTIALFWGYNEHNIMNINLMNINLIYYIDTFNYCKDKIILTL